MKQEPNSFFRPVLKKKVLELKITNIRGEMYIDNYCSLDLADLAEHMHTLEEKIILLEWKDISKHTKIAS